MSVLVVMKVSGDTATFRKAMAERVDELEASAGRAKEAGAIHHRFGIGDGFVQVIDEWENGEQFQTFFGDPKMQEFVASLGADTSNPPEITITEAIASPDEF
jgi:quinol monooxygenase YgiN